MKKCIRCNTDNPDGSKFCSGCGMLLDSIETNNQVVNNQTNLNNEPNSINNQKLFNDIINTNTINKNNLLDNNVPLAGTNNMNKLHGNKINPQKLIIYMALVVIVIVAGINITNYVTSSVKEAKMTIIKTDFEKLYSEELNKIQKNGSGYAIIEFPSDDLTISAKYEYFDKGYLIIYDQTTFAAKISSGNYCITKKYEEDTIHLSTQGPCEDTTIEYKK